MISGLTKNYYITSSMQKISSIHSPILEIKQILESQDLKSHIHIWPCAYPKNHLPFLTLCTSMQKVSSIHSSISEIQQIMESRDLKKDTPIFDHVHPITIKVTLSFLKYRLACKELARFIHSLKLVSHVHFWPSPKNY